MELKDYKFFGLRFIRPRLIRINYGAVNFSAKAKNIIRTYSMPGIELGFKKTLQKVFKVENLSEKSTLSPSLIEEYDTKELEVYKRKKFFNMSGLDLSLLKNSMLWILQTLDPKLSDYYELDNESILKILPNDSNSGFPMFKRKGDQDVREQLMRDVHSYFKTRDNAKPLFLALHPTVIFHRFVVKSESIYDDAVTYKIRNVWGVPYLILYLEVKFLFWFKVLFTNRMGDFFTSGSNRVDISNKIGIVRDKAKREGKYILCGDISGFDKSVPPPFYTLFSMLFCNVDNEFFRTNLANLLNYTCYTPFFGVDNKVSNTIGSTTSGSYLTTIFNSFCTILVLTYIILHLHKRFPTAGDFLAQGDDFIIIVNDFDDLLEVKRIFRLFNFRLKLYEECVVSYVGEIIFLGFYWDMMNAPNQTDDWLISRILYPEKFVELAGPDRIIARYLTLIFQIVRWRSLFKLFYEYDPHFARKMRINDYLDLRILDRNGNISKNRFPIEYFYEVGWRGF
uniref:Rna-dependent rna polymerase-like protein n=1 Tax=Tetraselmis sp. GSL018 TaxID=582737 RepID=A0A061R9I1_9CHLO|mmetsp:Transcript_5426/g.13216  ORF Transcript_5426/g.13216 Transcript_5426/m.13216 type:complete len:508 (-) Transcript_5426:78-1601(-)